MLNIKFIIDNPELVKTNIRNRNLSLDIDGLIEIYRKKNELQAAVDDLRNQRNIINKQISAASQDDRQSLIDKSKKLKEEIAQKEVGLDELSRKYVEELKKVPNISHPDSPIGKNEDDNVEISRYKEPTEFAFTPKDHVELGRELDLIDFQAAAKVSGARFYFLKNEAVLLEYALTRFALDVLLENGFTLVSTPDLAKSEILEGIGFNPRGNETQVYTIEDSDLCLIGTSEITLGGMYSNTTIDEDDLPLKLAGISHCFRTEAGSYGKFSKGLYRVHQFTKIEMFAFTHPDKSGEMHEYLRQIEEQLYKELDIPFRTVDICTGDLGGPAYRKYDLEAWMPGRHNEDKNVAGNWGEITSTSNCTDYQSRRLNIKYKSKETGKTAYLHTLNGTAFAISRTLLAILENYQQEDGSIKVPGALQKYLDFDVIN